MKVCIFWFRRDLRLSDNIGLSKALASGLPVVPLFIFDKAIIDELPRDDARVQFIHQQLNHLNEQLQVFNSGLIVKYGDVSQIWQEILTDYQVRLVVVNRDYEPYAIDRDQQVNHLLQQQGVALETYKDQVIFEPQEVLKKDGLPYTVYTPYSREWLKKSSARGLDPQAQIDGKFHPKRKVIPALDQLGFKKSSIIVRPFSLSSLENYPDTRDFPAKDNTSYLSTHLRFGTVSIRNIVRQLKSNHMTFLKELIWREFFMQILFHFPDVVNQNFRKKYDRIQWRNNEEEFEKWCTGQTGYPLVDAGMRQLNETGYMHNRVRMVVASFLCKHLLIDWRWGEAYFAEKLLDYELASNNGNWQWAAGTGCDAAPYFRIFNPSEQLKKFDKEMSYVKKWVPELLTTEYPAPMVDHNKARERALRIYKEGIDLSEVYH
ncbi:MAG: deoxyribodipyrimidine photo-lyase [Cyclobacteriaceae bacterium]